MKIHRRKSCRTCHVEKCIRLFYKRPDSLDGHGGECKVCQNARNMANYYKSRSRRLKQQKARRQTEAFKVKDLAWRKKYYATPKGREMRRESRRAWEILNPEKRRAVVRAWKDRRKQAEMRA